MSWGEAYAAAFQESKDASLLGDYSKPASRRAVLGKMHAAKLAQWRQCREGCHKAGLAGDPLDEALAGGGASEADFERWPADDGSGGTVWIRSGSPDVVRVVPLGGGWRVDLRVGAGWRSGDVYGSELEADTAARELLDVPF